MYNFLCVHLKINRQDLPHRSIHNFPLKTGQGEQGWKRGSFWTQVYQGLLCWRQALHPLGVQVKRSSGYQVTHCDAPWCPSLYYSVTSVLKGFSTLHWMFACMFSHKAVIMNHKMTKTIKTEINEKGREIDTYNTIQNWQLRKSARDQRKKQGIKS